MKRPKMMKVMLSTIIAASLAATPIYAEEIGGSNATVQANTTVKMKFPDISSTHWAMRHITKLAVEGVIEGYEDGSYRSENQVTQEEVIVMAIRMMGLEGQVKASSSSYVFPMTGISSYAEPYIALAYEKRLINLQEEVDATPKNVEWGKRNASREWVAKIVIRAIGQQSVADSLSSTPTPFVDNQEISPSSVGYVNAAVGLEIVNGFEDGSFKPSGEVTRAQVATFLSRSQKELTGLPPRGAKGYVTGLTNSTITIEDRNGVSSTYNFNNDTVFYGKQNDEKIVPSTIQQTYEVSLVQVGGKAYYVEVTNDELQMDIYEGKLMQVNLEKMAVTLLREGNFEYYEISPDVSVTDLEGRGSSLAALIENSIVEVRRSKLSKSEKYTQIVVKQVPINKSSEGTIQSIQKDLNKITVLETATGQSETFSLSSQVITTFTDNSLADVNNLHVGDTIAYDVVNSDVAKIVIKKQADIGITVEGTLTAWSPDKTIITTVKSVGSKPDSFYLAKNVQVKIDGLATAGIFDIEIGDVLKMEVLNNEVTRIDVTSRSIENLYFANIISIGTDNKIINVRDAAGKLRVYEITDSTTLMFNGIAVPKSTFTSYFSVGKKVDLKVSKDKLLSMSLSTSLEGTISQLNLNTNDLTVQVANGQNLSFKLTVPQVEIPNKPNSTTSNLRVGDSVTVSLSYDQAMVTKIAVNQKVLFKTLLKNVNSKQITLADENNVSFVYNLDTIPLVYQNQDPAAFADIPTDEYIKLSFKGMTVTKAEIVNPLRGKVTAVDSASTSVTVQDSNGNSQVVNLGSSHRVKQNGGAALTFASIKVGDRVLMMKDANDQMLVQVAYSSQREYASYNNVLNQLIFKPNAAGEKQNYNIHPKVYYHKGSELLSISSFAANDIVKIYVLDDKIVEMEKQ